MRFRALTFDCYGTLIDWDTGIGLWLEGWAATKGIAADRDSLMEDFAEAQRIEQATPVFQPYRTVVAKALAALARAADVTVSEGELEEFSASVATWAPFADSVPALEELKRQGRVLGVISNVDNDLFAGTQALLGNPFDDVVTAEDVQSYKPRLAHFHAIGNKLAERCIGEDAILHVARSKFHDIETGNALGWSNCWVNRRHGEKSRGVGLPSNAEPTWQVTSMAEVVALLAEIDPL